LLAQLADGGRLLAPLGTAGSQHMVRVTRHAADLVEEHLAADTFVPLIGRHGFNP
jgi:protein-L-isoaspartate(D-aspartate) O-methyltransferase